MKSFNAEWPQHISVEEALAGGSDARNPKLQLLFLRLGMVEAFGTGLKGIRALYEAEGLEPEVCAYPAMFRLSLPNVNAVRNSYLTPRGNSGPNLRGDYSDYEQLEREGALPPDVSQAFCIRASAARGARVDEWRLRPRGACQARGGAWL